MWFWLSKKKYRLHKSGFAMRMRSIANVCKDFTKSVFSVVIDFGILCND